MRFYEQKTGTWPSRLAEIGFDDQGLAYAVQGTDCRIHIASTEKADWNHGFHWTSAGG